MKKYEIDSLYRNNVRMVGSRNVACRYTAGPCSPGGKKMVAACGYR